MKRFHVSLSVQDLQRSVDFYTTLFDVAPTVLKAEYAKWMLDDPKINFSLRISAGNKGVSHVGLQLDDMEQLGEIQQRLQFAGQNTFDQPNAECCYAKSSKSWVRDPDDVAWEVFVTHGEITHYGADVVVEQNVRQLTEAAVLSECCKTATDASCCR
jgi:catechol 2,3-dioxygenase-like lactoylglutathione lyase family enzyme